MASHETAAPGPTQTDHEDPDPIWFSSRTARQIHGLQEAERDISRLMSLAASSISLLTLPQTDDPEAPLPQGGERSEQFVLEVSQYFECLDNVQVHIRSALAHIRQSRIAPSAITAPPPGFVPPSLGAGLPEGDGEDYERGSQGLQEERVETDAWRGILDALTRLKDARERERAARAEGGDDAGTPMTLGL